MLVIFDSKFKTHVRIIGQGEYYGSPKGEIISTTLGSCIAVCFYDPVAKIGGMNHYMLPEPAVEQGTIVFGKAKYGINSMEMLINGLLKLGAERERFVAKIFGGANMFKTMVDRTLESVGEQNISFARRYLHTEKIPILSEDVGKDHARKIYFDAANGNVKLFRLTTREDDEKIAHEEIKYKSVVATINKKSTITKATEEKEEKKSDVKDKITFF